VVALELNNLYQLLSTSSHRIEPHHETWMLWLKRKSREELFEVAIGTILVQNTNWNNVDLAISNLYRSNIKSFENLLDLGIIQLEEMIKPAGFYKQKSQALIFLAEVFLEYDSKGLGPPSRDELLRIKGVGKETADSLLVYCFYVSVPIIGTYTRRFFARIYGEIHYLKEKYEIIQEFIAKSISSDYYTLGKFHALIVSHSQLVCKKFDPLCDKCHLKDLCTFGKFHPTQPDLLQIQEAISQPKTAN
jgi:endonuclease-3 related protein